MTSKFAILPAAAFALAFLAAPASAGIKMNGLSTNGLSTNGLSSNGLSSNGVQLNGTTPNSRAKAQALARPKLREIVLANGEHVRLK